MPTKKLLQFVRNFSPIDYFIIILMLAVAVVLFIFFRPTEKWLEIILFDDRSTPSKVNALKIGDYEKNPYGKNVAEIIDIQTYPLSSNNTIANNIYLKIKILSQLNSRTGEYSYKGKLVKIGSQIQFNFPRTIVSGYIDDVEGLADKFPSQQKMVTLKLLRVQQWVVDGIAVGTAELDLKNNKIIEVISKEVAPADITTTTNLGEPLWRKDPRVFDVTLKTRVQVQDINNTLAFKKIYVIAVGQNLTFKANNTIIEGVITNVE